jgi:hypothetical protein
VIKGCLNYIELNSGYAQYCFPVTSDEKSTFRLTVFSNLLLAVGEIGIKGKKYSASHGRSEYKITQ